MRLFEHANYKFIEKRKTLYVVSAILILTGIGGMIVNVATQVVCFRTPKMNLIRQGAQRYLTAPNDTRL